MQKGLKTGYFFFAVFFFFLVAMLFSFLKD